MEGHKPWRQNLEISTPERHRSYALLTVLHLRLQDPRKGVPRGRAGPQNKDSRRQELDTGTFCRWPTRDLWKGGSSRPSVAIPLEVFCSHRHPSHSGEPSGGSRTQPPREVLLRLSQIQVPTFPGSTNTLARHGRRVPIVEFAPRAQLRGAESPPPTLHNPISALGGAGCTFVDYNALESKSSQSGMHWYQGRKRCPQRN